MAATNLTQQQIQALIVASANQHGVDPALALAIAQTESGFNPSAVSPANKNGTQDFGLMQINSSNLAALGLDQGSALDPQANVDAAMTLLAQYTQKYGDNPNLIAWAYNAGPGSVASGSVPASTSGYISTVLTNMGSYSGLPSDLADTSGDSLSVSDALGTPGNTSGLTVAGVTLSPVVLAAAGLLFLAWWLAD